MLISKYHKFFCLISCICLCGCVTRVDRIQGQFEIKNQEDPALSGDGEKLALIVDYNGRPTIELRDLRNGKILPLRHFSRNQPHSSPSLSWNARYVAVIAQRGNRRLAIIEDRVSGRSHQFPIPGQRIPVRLSLAPDGSQLALQLAEKGQWRIELFDLRQKMELDQPAGISLLKNSFDATP